MSHRQVPRSATVFTPANLAAAMVRACSFSKTDRWLDPCVGDGAFVVEMAGLGVDPGRIVAVDLAPRQNVCDRLATTVRGVDFLAWAKEHENSVDHVVMNPPWVAINKLGGMPRRNALGVKLSDGRHMPLGANYWCPFLLEATACLRSGGTLVAILPAAWDFAQYATRMREEVVRAFGRVVVIRSMTPLFPSVKDGSVVVVCSDRGANGCRLTRVEVPDLVGTVEALETIARGRQPTTGSVLHSIARAEQQRVRLDSIIGIGIGAVTGDARYFLLSEAQRQNLALPLSSVQPILSRGRHLAAPVMTAKEWRKLKKEGERIWLFRPGTAARRNRAVRSYLWHGARGSCDVDAFKVSSRPQWHQTRLPTRADAFISGMSKTKLPYLVLKGMAKLTASNTLYVVRFRQAGSLEKRAALGLLLLTSDVRQELQRRARNYADGLLKFEPRELGKILVPRIQRTSGALAAFKRATALLLSGRCTEAEAVANEWVEAAVAPRRQLASDAGGARRAG